MSDQHLEDEPYENMANKAYSDLFQYILFKDCSVPLTEYFIQGYQLQCTFDRVFYSRISIAVYLWQSILFKDFDDIIPMLHEIFCTKYKL